jgi:hypothetical protein
LAVFVTAVTSAPRALAIWTPKLAYHGLDSHILGFTMWEAGYTAGSDDLDEQASAFLRELMLADYPYLAEHVQEHIEPTDGKGVREFEFGLDFLLDGLERRLAGPA